MNSHTVFKQTGTHADALAAIGAADLLRRLEPRIVEFEDRFEIQLTRPLLPSDLDTVEPGFSYLLRFQRDKSSVPPERVMDIRSLLPVLDAEVSCAVAGESRMYSILGRMKSYGGPNKVISEYAASNRAKWQKGVWNSLNGSPGFRLSAPLVQLFNPQSARGYALTKPRGTDRSDKTKDRWGEPFLEWMRYRGYFEGSAGWFASGDLRLFCPIPADIPYHVLAAVATEFRELNLGGTAVKMDCRAVLGLTRLLVENSHVLRRPRLAVRGVWVSHYKDMGQAHKIMGMDQLALPDWFELKTERQARMWLDILELHDTVLRRLVDSHSDELALLQQYRRTFQMRREDSIAEFTTFLMDYAVVVFQRRALDHWMLPQFPLFSVSPILRRDQSFRLMLRNPGFMAVAAAIRSSTFGAQAFHHNNRPNHREIRYGLLADIRRASRLGKSELLRVVEPFIRAFNREAVRHQASGLPAMQITRGEFDEFSNLLERLPSGFSCGSLLCGIAGCLPSRIFADRYEREEQVQAIPA